MNIIIAEASGFCFGVRRALDIVKKESIEDKKELTILGDLVHNPQVIADLKDKGIEIVDSLEKVKTDNLVITAHGIADSIKEKAKKKGYTIIDTTCPLVQKIHDKVKKLKEDGYKIMVIGNKDHVEVIGFTKDLDECIFISSPEDIEKNKDRLKGKIGIVTQSTEDMNKVMDIIEKLARYCQDFEFHDTICFETKMRQAAARQLAKKVDIMVVIGGKKSSNTAKLTEICKKHTTTHHIESADELKEGWFKNISEVGITAGASTPDSVIRQVEEKIKNI